MRVHVLQHVPFEGLGSIASWLEARQAEVTHTRFFESDVLPELAEVDFVIALGGPMSVNDEQELPWLVREKRWIAEAIRAGKPVLGICLGAQLMASALGAKVYPGEQKEIGWFPVRACAMERDVSVFQFPLQSVAFHWHGETFDLPAGAVHLARSAGCENQAFQMGPRAIGLQFHLETTAESAKSIVTHCAHELIPARYVQSREQIESADAERYTGANALMAQVLAYLARDVGCAASAASAEN